MSILQGKHMMKIWEKTQKKNSQPKFSQKWNGTIVPSKESKEKKEGRETNFQELNLIAETQNLTSTAMLMKPYLLLINYLATRPIFMNTIPKA